MTAIDFTVDLEKHLRPWE